MQPITPMIVDEISSLYSNQDQTSRSLQRSTSLKRARSVSDEITNESKKLCVVGNCESVNLPYDLWDDVFAAIGEAYHPTTVLQFRAVCVNFKQYIENRSFLKVYWIGYQSLKAGHALAKSTRLIHEKYTYNFYAKFMYADKAWHCSSHSECPYARGISQELYLNSNFLVVKVLSAYAATLPETSNPIELCLMVDTLQRYNTDKINSVYEKINTILSKKKWNQQKNDYKRARGCHQPSIAFSDCLEDDECFKNALSCIGMKPRIALDLIYKYHSDPMSAFVTFVHGYSRRVAKPNFDREKIHFETQEIFKFGFIDSFDSALYIDCVAHMCKSVAMAIGFVPSYLTESLLELIDREEHFNPGMMSALEVIMEHSRSFFCANGESDDAYAEDTVNFFLQWVNLFGNLYFPEKRKIFMWLYSKFPAYSRFLNLGTVHIVDYIKSIVDMRGLDISLLKYAPFLAPIDLNLSMKMIMNQNDVSAKVKALLQIDRCALAPFTQSIQNAFAIHKNTRPEHVEQILTLHSHIGNSTYVKTFMETCTTLVADLDDISHKKFLIACARGGFNSNSGASITALNNATQIADMPSTLGEIEWMLDGIKCINLDSYVNLVSQIYAHTQQLTDKTLQAEIFLWLADRCITD